MASAGDSNQLARCESQRIIAVTLENMREYFQVVTNELGVQSYKIVANDKVIVFGSVCEASGKEIVEGILTSDEKISLRRQLEDALESDEEQEKNEISEDVIVEELQRSPICANDVCRTLRKLSVLAIDIDVWRFDLVKLVLDVTFNCPEELDVQRAALNCLRRLVKQLKYEDSGNHLRLILQVVLNTVDKFSEDTRLLDAALEILINKNIRHFFKCEEEAEIRKLCQILMKAINVSDENITNLSLQLFVYLLQLTSISSLKKFAQDATFVRKLFAIIDNRLQLSKCDATLQMTLEACNCVAIFIDIQQSEFNLLQLILDRFSNSRVKQKVLSILEYTSRSNSEVCQNMAPCLIEELINYVNCDNTTLSFLAVTILIRRFDCVDGDKSLTKILMCLKSAVKRWDSPDEELTNFHSLSPLVNLLITSEYPEIKFYAVWTLHHLCSTTNSKHYVKLFYTEKLIDDIDTYFNTSSVEDEIANHIRNIFYLAGHEIYPGDVAPVLLKKKYPDLKDVILALEDSSLPENMVKDKLMVLSILIEKESKIPADYATKVISNISERYKTSDDINKVVLSCYLKVIHHLRLQKDVFEFRTVTRHALKCMKMFIDDLNTQNNAFDVIIEAVYSGFDDLDQHACVQHAMDVLFTFDSDLFNEKCLRVMNIITSKMNPFAMDSVGLKTSHIEKLSKIVNNMAVTKELKNTDTLLMLRNLSRGEQVQRCFADNNIHDVLSNTLSLFMAKTDAVELILEIFINVITSNLVDIQNLHYLNKLLQSQIFSIAYRALSLAVTAVHCQQIEPELKVYLENKLPDILLKFRNVAAKDVPILHPTWFLCNNLLHSSHPQCQFYAVWVLRSVCSTDTVKYCKQIVESGDNLELEILLEDLNGDWCSDKYCIKDEIIVLLNETWNIIKQNQFCDLKDGNVILKELQEAALDPHIIQCYIHSLSMQAETFKFSSSDIIVILNILKAKQQHLGITRECFLFFARVARFRSSSFANSTIIDIFAEIGKLESESLISTLRFGFEFIKCWTVEEFGLRYTIINFLLNNMSNLNASHRMACPSVIQYLIPLKCYKSIAGWTEMTIDITPLITILKMDVMTLSNLHVICCFRLIRCINCLSIFCIYPADIAQVVARVVNAFYFDDEIAYEGIALLASISRLGFFSNNPQSFVIDFALRLMKSQKFDISFCAVACIVQISYFKPSALQYYYEDDVIEVIMQWGRPNVYKYNIHKMSGYYNFDYLISVRVSPVIICDVFALWVIRQLFTINNELTQEGWKLKNVITSNIYDNYEVNYDNDNVKTLMNDVTAVLRRYMN